MADFSFLSDSDDDKAVEELLSQAMDQSVLEQVAAINCSGFTDSVLPTHLEVRFQKLKSFPSANPKSKPSTHSQSHYASSSVFKSSIEDESVSNSHFHVQNDSESNGLALNSNKNSVDEEGSKGNSISEYGSNPSKSLSFSSKDEIFSHPKKNPTRKMGLKGNSESELYSELSNSFDFSAEEEIFSLSNKIPVGRKARTSKSPSGSSSFPADSSTESLSPPQRSGCLWCSPKRSSQNKENRAVNVGLEWEKNNEILSDLNSVSWKKQQKLLQKAMKEEEKISREAEKIVKWAKQASARIEVSGIER